MGPAAPAENLHALSVRIYAPLYGVRQLVVKARPAAPRGKSILCEVERSVTLSTEINAWKSLFRFLAQRRGLCFFVEEHPLFYGRKSMVALHGISFSTCAQLN
jgi:hypothetical protein